MLVIVGLAGLASCATKLGEPFTTPDGRQGYVVSCNAAAFNAGSFAACQTDAREICKGNYVETNRNLVPGGDGRYTARSIEIVCEPSPVNSGA